MENIAVAADTDVTGFKLCAFINNNAGIGIKEREKYEIFTRFKRSKEALQVNEEGTGLGLAIVKHVALKYHYKIEVNSKENEYSEFIVYFNDKLK